MSDPAANVLLIVVAIAYLGGAVVVVAALAKVLATWWHGWRTRLVAEPVDQAPRAAGEARRHAPPLGQRGNRQLTPKTRSSRAVYDGATLSVIQSYGRSRWLF